jgi:cysteine-rich repeat protein
LFQGVSEGLTVWKLELHPDSFAGAVLSEVAIHHTKSTTERITVISDNMNESHIGDMFARSMQGQLEGLSKFMSDSNTKESYALFSDLFFLSNQAWYEGLDGISKLQSIASSEELDAFLLDGISDITQAVCSKLQENSNIDSHWDANSCDTKVKDSRAVVVNSKFNNVFPTDVFDHWSEKMCSGTPKCGTGGPKECGEDCDDGNNNDGDGCSRNCLVEVDCDAQQCDPLGTVGNWLPTASPGSGPVTTLRPVLPNMMQETPVDLVYSRGSGIDGSYALMITRHSISGNFSLWKASVNPITNAFDLPERIYYSTSTNVTGRSILSAVRLIGSSALHGEFALLVDTGACALRKVELVPPFTSSVFVGSESGLCGFADDVGTAALFHHPTDLQVVASSKYSIAIIADRDNNCIRRLNLNTMAVTTYSGVCAGIDLVASSSHSGNLSEHWIASSVRYIQPQRIIMHADEQFAMVLCNYVYAQDRRTELVALFQLHLINGIARGHESWDGKPIQPGSANKFLDPIDIKRRNPYPPKDELELPHLGFLFDPVGENMYVSLNDVNVTKIFYCNIKSESLALRLVEWDASTVELVKDSWHLRLSMPPSAQHIDVIDFTNSRILQIPMARPAGPWGPNKKCLKSGKCSCLAGFSGDLCDGDQCPHDPEKTLPGVCGCGRSDANGTGWAITDPKEC